MDSKIFFYFFLCVRFDGWLFSPFWWVGKCRIFAIFRIVERVALWLSLCHWQCQSQYFPRNQHFQHASFRKLYFVEKFFCICAINLMRSSLGVKAECYFYHILSAVLSVRSCVFVFILFSYSADVKQKRCCFPHLTRSFRGSPCTGCHITNVVHLIFHLLGIHAIYEKISKLWSSIIVSINCIPEKHQSRHAKFLHLPWQTIIEKNAYIHEPCTHTEHTLAIRTRSPPPHTACIQTYRLPQFPLKMRSTNSIHSTNKCK